jgi:uncharacterized protein (TIGR00251 family)
MTIPITTSASGVSFKIKVHPRAKKNAITGTVGDALKISVTAPPADSKANQAVIEFLADFFEIPRSSVTIASGDTGRLKVIRISGMSADQLRGALAETTE